MGIRESIKETIRSIKKWTWHHAVAFLITYFSYTFFRACRKAYSNIKDSLGKTWSPDPDLYPYDVWQKENLFNDSKDADVFLGEVDAIFLSTYTFGLFIFGILGDRINLRLMLATGMIGSAILTFLFGYASAVLSIKNLWFFRCIWGLNGLFQSTGWPATVAIMGNWFRSVFVFGFWSGNASLGNIFGSLMVVSVLHYGYEYGMLLNSLLIFCGGIVVIFCLVIHPNDVGLCPANKFDEINRHFKNYEDSQNDEVFVGKPKAISFIQALLIPGVIPYSLSYACLKLANYTFFFWLRTYLQQGLYWDDSISDKLLNFYDIGSILGGIIASIISNIMGYRSPIVSTMLALLMAFLFIYQQFSTTYTLNVTLMMIIGFFTGGPASMISTVITADLGKHKKIRGSAIALSTVTGIISGTGSLGVTIGQYLVDVINKHLGWHYVFYMSIIMAGVSISCILPIVISELKIHSKATYVQISS